MIRNFLRIDRVAAEIRCTVSVAARFLRAEGVAVHGVDQGDVVFAAAHDVIKHLAKMEVRLAAARATA